MRTTLRLRNATLTAHFFEMGSSSSSNPSHGRKWLWSLVHVSIWLCFAALGSSLLLEYVYHNYVMPIVESYRRDELVNNFYDKFRNEFTYYNRHCDARDISTTDSSDLIVTSDMPPAKAGSVMLEHGAIAIPQVLSPKAAGDLRNYLAGKHEAKLDFNEVFWQEMDRLALVLGTHDDPSVAAALDEIGNNEHLKKALKGIVGDDPVIIEVSTLTSLHDSSFQEFHSDSDWFGSSLLYANSFLHTYSMFVALQNTTQTLGATAVCPGTHYCANEDILEMCMQNGAFSVSTNGYTGPEKGMLAAGDALLFNQNIWHRGPGNVDPSGDDRIMLVMTFGSRKRVEHDYRRQGLGTYYYMRWNMWGHTLEDLKYASRNVVQPWAALKALGLAPSRGITWIHQFAQQLGPASDFYDAGVLFDFKNFLNSQNFPESLRSDAMRWEDFIPETLHIWVSRLTTIYFLALLAGAGTLLLFGRRRTRSFATTSIIGHVIIVFLLAEALAHVKQSDLGKSVVTNDVALRPFADQLDTEPEGISTLPERHDVLFSPRLQDEYLESFTRFLDFHPGNKDWLIDIHAASNTLPTEKYEAVAEAIVRRTVGTKHDGGLSPRFLGQDMGTGRWYVLSEANAVQKTLNRLSNANADDTILHLKNANAQDHWIAQWARDGTYPKKEEDSEAEKYTAGDRVWAWDSESLSWVQAKMRGPLEEEDMYSVELSHIGVAEMHDEDLRPYNVIHAGDTVNVDYHGDGSEYFQGKVTGVHPDGSHSVQYDDGEYAERVLHFQLDKM